MAFPNTPILSTFPGANEEPLSEGGAWGGTIRATAVNRDRARLLSNAVAQSSNASVIASESVWATSFPADMEVFATLTATPTTATNGPALYARVQQEGTTGADAYNLSYVLGTGLQFYRMVNSSFTQLGSTVVQVLSAGDSFGLTVSSSTLEGWYKPAAGPWTSIGTQTDSNITGPGKIGLALIGGSGETHRLDNFGGGSMFTQVNPPVGFRGRGAC